MRHDRKAALISTLRQSRALLADVADTTRALAFSDTVAGKVPVLKWAVAAKEAIGAFQRERLNRNAAAFLQAFDAATSPEQSAAFVSALRADPAFSDSFAEAVVSVLLEAARPKKAEVLGNLCAALAAGAIPKDAFTQYALVLEAASVPSVLALESYLDAHTAIQHTKFADEEPLLLAMGVAWRHGSALRISPVGEALYVHGFRKALRAHP